MLIIYDFLNISLFLCVYFSLYGVLRCRLLMEKIFNLIAVFLSISFWLLLCGFDFIALIVLLLYIGAIAVLFLFVVMITNTDSLGEEAGSNRPAFETVYSAWLNDVYPVTLLYVVLYMADPKEWTLRVTKTLEPVAEIQAVKIVRFWVMFLLGSSFLNSWLGQAEYLISEVFRQWFVGGALTRPLAIELASFPFNSYNSKLGSDILLIGELLYSQYMTSLLLLGLMLLVAIMGAILLTLRRVMGIKRQNLNQQYFRYRD